MFENYKFFDEGATGGGEKPGSGESATTTTTSNGTGTSDGKTYTQADLDRMFADRARQAESSLLKKLGFEKAEDAQSAFTRLKTIEEGQKTELQKAQDRVAELERSNTEQATKQKELATQYEVATVATRLGIVDPDAAYRLVDLSKLEYGEDGKPKNVEAVLKEMIGQKPYLVGSGTSATNAARGNPGSKTFTKSQIEDRKFWEANRDEILKAMAEGRIVED